MAKTKVSSKYYLLSISTNWADEMTVEGHLALTQKEFDKWKARFDKLNFPVRVYVGTNEDLDVYKDDIKIQSITESDYKTLKKLGLKDIGHTNCIDIEVFRF